MADTIYKVRDPQGNLREIRGPEGASDEEIIAQAQRLLAPAGGGIPGPRVEAPAWAKEYPGVYEAAVGARRTFGPALEMAGALAGGAIGGAAGTVAAPTVVVNPISGAIAGSALGYGAVKQGLRAADVALGLALPDTPLGEAQRAAMGVGEGALYEAGGRAIVGPALNKLVELGAAGAGKFMDLNQLPKQLAGKIFRQSLETPENIAAARQAIAAAPADVTTQQTLAAGGVISPGTQAILERAVAKKAPAAMAAKEAAQETARKATIEGVTPDLAAAISARRAAAQPFYAEADRTVVPLDRDLTGVLSRLPEGTIEAARKMAKMEGRPFVMEAKPSPMIELTGEPSSVTGETLHYIKRALSDVAYGPVSATGAGRDSQLAARGLLDDYLKTVESKVPAYGEARRTFADLSAPVNQAQVLKEMASVLERPGGGERIGPFLNVLGRGEEAMLKRAGGRGAPRYESLSEVLTPDQLSKVRDVARQLEAQATVGRQVSQGEQRATELIKDEIPNYRVPNVFNVWITSANKVLDILGVRAGKRTMEQMSKAALSAKTFDEMLALMPGAERSKLLKTISDPDTWKTIRPQGGAMTVGAAALQPPTNALTPQQESENALAR